MNDVMRLPSRDQIAANRAAAAKPSLRHVIHPTWLPPVDASSRIARGPYPGPIRVYGEPVPAPTSSET